jgi:hypothetical protein
MYQLSGEAAQVALLTCIPEVLGSNLIPDTDLQ